MAGGWQPGDRVTYWANDGSRVPAVIVGKLTRWGGRQAYRIKIDESVGWKVRVRVVGAFSVCPLDRVDAGSSS